MNFLVCDLSLIDRTNYKSKADERVLYDDAKHDMHWNNPDAHAPISWHSYAACMSPNGRFICAPDDKLGEWIKWSDCILALWNYNPKAAQDVIVKMKKLGKKVIGAFHENGDTFQFHARNIQWLVDFKNCANACDAVLTYPRDIVYEELFENIGIEKSKLLYVPQPYYIEKQNDFIVPIENRRGIFVAPLKKDQEIERRNWIYNVVYASSEIRKSEGNILNRVTTINVSTQYSNEELRRLLQELIGNDIEINVVGQQKYHDYLRLIAGHQYTINLDSSDTQGQVDADSMFVKVPLLQNKNVLYRTDFGDLYAETNCVFEYDFKEQYQANVEACEKVMNRYSKFDVVRNKLTYWYEER